MLRPLIEMMKIVRLMLLPPDMHRLSSSQSRLRHGRQHAPPSLLNLCILSSVRSLVFLILFFYQLSCSSPKGSASVFADYLRSYFSVSQPMALRKKVRDYLPKLRRAKRPEKSHLSFFFSVSSTEFLAVATNLSLSPANDPGKVAYAMLKHFPPSGMNFLLHIFNFSWFLNSFLSIWKISSITTIHKMGKPFDAPASFRSIFRTS